MALALTDEQNELIRQLARRLVERTPNENVSEVARTIHVDQSWLHRFLKGKVGASFQTASIIAKHNGESAVDLLGMAEEPAVTWRDLPGFEDAFEKAKETMGDRFSGAIWERVGGFSMPPHPPAVEPWMLIQVASLVESLSAKQLTPAPSSAPPGGGQNKSVRRLRGRKPR